MGNNRAGINLCKDDRQHCWVQLPKGKGLQCYSCPMCEQVVYYSDAARCWIKPATSGGKPIRGNARPEADERGNDLVKNYPEYDGAVVKSAQLTEATQERKESNG